MRLQAVSFAFLSDQGEQCFHGQEHRAEAQHNLVIADARLERVCKECIPIHSEPDPNRSSSIKAKCDSVKKINESKKSQTRQSSKAGRTWAPCQDSQGEDSNS